MTNTAAVQRLVVKWHLAEPSKLWKLIPNSSDCWYFISQAWGPQLSPPCPHLPLHVPPPSSPSMLPFRVSSPLIDDSFTGRSVVGTPAREKSLFSEKATSQAGVGRPTLSCCCLWDSFNSTHTFTRRLKFLWMGFTLMTLIGQISFWGKVCKEHFLSLEMLWCWH